MSSLSSYFFRYLMRRSVLFGKPELTIAERREKIEKAARMIFTPVGVKVLPVDAGGVPADWEIPAGAPGDRAILYIHGGAWTICSPRTHRSMVAYLAKAARIRALSIGYRLAPENPFPAGLDDCLAAYRWLLAQGILPSKIVIAGDSAGGNLTLATLLALRDSGEPLPAAAVCLSPATDLAATGDSVHTRSSVEVVLRRRKGGSIIDLYAPGCDVQNPLISPLYGDLKGLPPILIHVGDHEVLLDNSIRFVERAREAGVNARVVIWPEMWHVFQMHVPFMRESRQSIQQLGAFIHEMVR